MHGFLAQCRWTSEIGYREGGQVALINYHISCSRAAASAVNLHAASDRSETLPTAYVNNTLVDNGYDPGMEA
jgi:hypothetical protein